MPICVLEIPSPPKTDLTDLFQIEQATYSYTDSTILVKIPYIKSEDSKDQSTIDLPSLRVICASFSDSRAYHLSDDYQLIPFGKTVPEKKLSVKRWISREDFFQIDLPWVTCKSITNLVIEENSKVPLQLAPSESYRKASVLRCHFDEFRRWVFDGLDCRFENRSLSDPLPKDNSDLSTTQLIVAKSKTQNKQSPFRSRIDSFKTIHFAVIDSQETYIFGNNLPPISGDFYYLLGNLVIQSGWCFRPNLDLSLLQKLLEVEKESLQIHSPDRRSISLDWENLVPISRSAVRLTESFLMKTERRS